MSGIMDVKNDRRKVRRKPATSVRLTRFASGTISDAVPAACSSTEGSAVDVDNVSSTDDSCVGEVFWLSVEVLLSAGFAPSTVSASSVLAVDAVGCTLAGPCASAAGSAAAGAGGALGRMGATFGRMP